MSPALLRRLEGVAATIDPALFRHPGSAELRRALYAAWPDGRIPLPRWRLVDWCREYAVDVAAVLARAEGEPPPGRAVVVIPPDCRDAPSGITTASDEAHRHGIGSALEPECTARAVG